MSSVDLSTNVLWHTLSRDVYSQGKGERGDPPETISEICEDASQPLLMSAATKREKSATKGSGWLMTSFLLVNTALGIGILNFPSAYDQAGGIFYATVIQIVMLILMISTMLILAYCSDVNGDRTYHDVLLSMCGRKGQQLAAVSITLTLYCVCVATLIIIGDQLDNLFHSAFGPNFCHHWYLHRHFTISATAILFILPMCFCKRVDFLGFIGPDNLSIMFSMFPVLGLGYQCQEVVVPIYSCMRERNLCNFIKSSSLAMAFLFCVYSVTGCFGFLTFGSHVAHNVMKMYNADDPFVMIGVGALIIKMIATYPILALCGRDAAGGVYAELRGLKPAEFVATERSRRYAVATVWFSSSLLLAVLTESIGVVIKYLGSVASANIFIYPGICLMQVVLKEDPDFTHRRSPYLIAYSVLIAGVGAFCFGVVLLEAILDNNPEPHVDLCNPFPVNQTTPIIQQ